MQGIGEELQQEMQLSQTLGVGLPINDLHAVSVSLPKWSDVVGYEEGKQEILHSLSSGYPRFRFHDAVYALMEILRALYPNMDSTNTQFSTDISKSLLIGEYTYNPYKSQVELEYNVGSLQWYIFPSKPIANRFSDFLQFDLDEKLTTLNDSEERLNIELLKNSIALFQLVDTPFVAVSFHEDLALTAKRYWQHSGEILSSRQAVWLVEELQKKFLVVHCYDPRTNQTTDAHSLTELRALQDRFIVRVSLQNPSQPVLDKHFTNYDEHASQVTHSPSSNVIAKRILEIVNAGEDSKIAEDDVGITICGMAAIFTAYRLIQRAYKQEHPAINHEIVVFGFPYLDTLKIMNRPEWNVGGVHFYGKANKQELRQLEQLLEAKKLPDSDKQYRNQVAAIFIEFPTNPLMRCPDVQRLTTLCSKYGVSLVADDTISSFANTNLLSSDGVSVDIMCSSLTKIFSGNGNVLGGSLLVNPQSPRYNLLEATFQHMKKEHDLPLISELDAAVLEKNSRSYLTRAHRINRNALALATHLQAHPLVEHVYYPGLSGEAKQAYDQVIRNDFHPSLTCPQSEEELFEAGYGCLLSFELKDSVSTEAFYDHLQTNKGPSLGTNFTLACPYTLLAHYMELSWAEEYGVRSKLIRVSVGLEHIEEIIAPFEAALQHSSV